MLDMFPLLKHAGIFLSSTCIIITHRCSVYSSIYQINNRFFTIPAINLDHNSSSGQLYIAQHSLPSLKPADNTATLPPIFCIQIFLPSLSGRQTPKVGARGGEDCQLEECILLSHLMENGIFCGCSCITFLVQRHLRI